MKITRMSNILLEFCTCFHPLREGTSSCHFKDLISQNIFETIPWVNVQVISALSLVFPLEYYYKISEVLARCGYFRVGL